MVEDRSQPRPGCHARPSPLPTAFLPATSWSLARQMPLAAAPSFSISSRFALKSLKGTPRHPSSLWVPGRTSLSRRTIRFSTRLRIRCRFDHIRDGGVYASAPSFRLGAEAYAACARFARRAPGLKLGGRRARGGGWVFMDVRIGTEFYVGCRRVHSEASVCTARHPGRGRAPRRTYRRCQMSVRAPGIRPGARTDKRGA